MILETPVATDRLDGQQLQFQTELRAGGLGGKLEVTGEVGADGSISGASGRSAGHRAVPYVHGRAQATF